MADPQNKPDKRWSVSNAPPSSAYTKATKQPNQPSLLAPAVFKASRSCSRSIYHPHIHCAPESKETIWELPSMSPTIFSHASHLFTSNLHQSFLSFSINSSPTIFLGPLSLTASFLKATLSNSHKAICPLQPGTSPSLKLSPHFLCYLSMLRPFSFYSPPINIDLNLKNSPI